MSEIADQSPARERLTSGITGLDPILKGGFLKGRTYLILGPPGAGKTVLSNQICFHQVSTGGRALYLTLLAETSSRMLADIQSFAFFSLEPVNDTLSYVSGYSALEHDGLNGLINLIRAEVRRQHATLLIIDGVMIAEQVATVNLDWKKFLHGLQASTELLGCTTFLLVPANEQYVSKGEQTMVEGVIELSTRLVDMRSVRELQVHKFRGSAFLEGKHLYTIDEAGFCVHPRLEATMAAAAATLSQPLANVTQLEQLKVGIAQLDEMLRGGFFSGSTTILLGTPGTGKTLLGSHFLLEGAAKGQKGLYYGFYETPTQLIRKLIRFGLDPNRAIADGQLELRWQSPIQDYLDILAEQILETVQRTGAKRIFLDGLSSFQRSVASEERLDLFLAAFFTALHALDVTTVCALEMPDLFSPAVELPIAFSGATRLVENVLLLRYVELHSQLYRLISIMKMRESGYDPSIREFRITDHGVEVASTFSSAEAILTGIARLRTEFQGVGASAGEETGRRPFPRQES